MPTKVEIKARCNNPKEVRAILRANDADFKGIDHQVDSYFEVPNGRLKLRQGDIENALIQYNREHKAGPKKASVKQYIPADGDSLKETLVAALGLLTEVDKTRHIYFIDSVMFHVDEVKGLGGFVKIEAVDKTDSGKEEHLMRRCKNYMKLLKIDEADLIEYSYSDMLLMQKATV